MSPQIEQRADDGDWLRQWALPEEWIIAHCPMARGGTYRRFESGNVIDLVRVRRERAEQQSRI
jgi:hypothetical protein